MIKEVIAKGSTINVAIDNGVNEIGVDKDLCQIEILETPKRTLFGKNKLAVVKITTEIVDEIVSNTNTQEVESVKDDVVESNSTTTSDTTSNTTSDTSVVDSVNSDSKEKSKLVIADLRNGTKTDLAVAYLTEILKSMKLEHITLTVNEYEDNAVIVLDGEGMAVLIGHHGETLDALQYLTTLTCNRDDGDYYRISLDCGNYRQKREETLKNLATRIATKVKRTGRSQLLEPMTPYERKVIHAVIADMEGVYSKSKGDEPNRKVLVLSENSTRYKNDKHDNQSDKSDV